MRILVAGATGQIGRHLVSQLHAAGHQVRALSRHSAAANLPHGIEVVKGDLTDETTLVHAFTGIEAIHLITFGGDDGADLTNGTEIVDLAVQHGIQRATVLSGWAPTSIEAALTSSRIDWTLLHPVENMLNTLEWIEEIRDTATVSTLATWPSAMVHEADIAAVAACALTQHGHGNRTYELTGPEALTPQQRTRTLAQATGRAITHVQLTEEQERQRLSNYGYPEEYIEFGIHLAINPPDAAGTVLPTVEQVTGRPARTFAQWAREHAATFRHEA